MGIKTTSLTHRRKDCIGCGSCAQIAPELWSMSKEDGKANLCRGVKKDEHFVSEIDEVEKQKAKECGKACPMGIIRVEE